MDGGGEGLAAVQAVHVDDPGHYRPVGPDPLHGVAHHEGVELEARRRIVGDQLGLGLPLGRGIDQGVVVGQPAFQGRAIPVDLRLVIALHRRGQVGGQTLGEGGWSDGGQQNRGAGEADNHG